MRTTVYDVPNDAWVEVGMSAQNVTAQLLSNGPVYVIATDATGFGSFPALTDRGLMMSRTGPDPVAIAVNDIPTDGKVYLRSSQEGEINKVAVMTLGETISEEPADQGDLG
ncbi:hypothetical protein LOKG_00043 [Loktanella phage pCB2051-A]|uniref:Uncharacterized protein n=1 Tax=Loktanella phage pCB2051-A TaxID=754044 RepID=M4QSZ8_9CAUD|nr:hypothetical protein LOKG_00043 [Loktanella phage pCB2051-A]AGH31479.1 hypothetical protein LOKG_00043 [Loktanella phage pCB2051-A]